MNVIQLLVYQIFGSDWIPVKPHVQLVRWIADSEVYCLVLVTEYQYKWMFGGKRWRGTHIKSFRSSDG